MDENKDCFREAKFGELKTLNTLSDATSEAMRKIIASIYPEDGYTTATSSPSYACGTSAYTTIDAVTLIEEIHRAVCKTLPNSDAVEALKNLLENIPCPIDDCKKCRFYNPGSVDFCNTAAKTAEFLIYNDYVKVSHKAIDKVKDS